MVGVEDDVLDDAVAVAVTVPSAGLLALLSLTSQTTVMRPALSNKSCGKPKRMDLSIIAMIETYSDRKFKCQVGNGVMEKTNCN